MTPKDTIYIDVDDEITAVINKVINSKAKLVVLVLPKRASVFHSSVNLKLLKNKSVKASKNLVLVSTDVNLLALAGVVGLNVAKNLQDKPTIPKVNQVEETTDEPVENQDDEEDGGADEKSKSIGEVAAMSAVGISDVEDQDVIEFDNDAKKEDVANNGSKTKEKKEKINKKLKVPDFGRFQKILVVSVFAIIAIVALYIYGFVYAPKAKITIQSTTSSLTNTIPFTLDSTVQTLNTANMIVPANLQTLQKTVTSTAVNTSGTKQIGIPASGTIIVTNECNPTYGSSSDVSIPVGTDFSDSNNNVYVSTQAVTLPGWSSPHCKSQSISVPVASSVVGSAYNNTSNSIDFTSTGNVISNFPSYDLVGGPMTGGYSKTVQIVAQADIDSATKQLVAPNSTTIEQQLSTAIKAAGYTPLTSTFVAVTPVVTPSNSVGTQTNTVTVSGAYSYSMYGAHLEDLDTLITDQVNQSSSFNPAKESILNTGSASATFTIESSSTTSAKVSMQASSLIGPKLDISSLISQSVGKSSAVVINNITNIPGVKSVTIKYSPFWVTAMPHNAKKITIVIEKADGSAA